MPRYGVGPSYCYGVPYDQSRYIIDWKLCISMKQDDATDALVLALAAYGCEIQG